MTRRRDAAERISVDVVVNHGPRRRGDRFDVNATPDVLALIAAGYLIPLGPAAPQRPEAEPEIVIIQPGPPAAQPGRRRRGGRVPVDS